jgi:hypothetical protein
MSWSNYGPDSYRDTVSQGGVSMDEIQQKAPSIEGVDTAISMALWFTEF